MNIIAFISKIHELLSAFTTIRISEDFNSNNIRKEYRFTEESRGWRQVWKSFSWYKTKRPKQKKIKNDVYSNLPVLVIDIDTIFCTNTFCKTNFSSVNHQNVSYLMRFKWSGSIILPIYSLPQRRFLKTYRKFSTNPLSNIFQYNSPMKYTLSPLIQSASNIIPFLL